MLHFNWLHLEFFTEALLEFLGKFFAEFWMRNGNQTLCALAERLTAKLRHAVLGDNIIDIAAASGNRPPVVMVVTILDADSSLVVECSAMMERPPLDKFAPRTKSIWPPMPEIWRRPIASAQTCPCRSTSTQE